MTTHAIAIPPENTAELRTGIMTAREASRPDTAAHSRRSATEGAPLPRAVPASSKTHGGKHYLFRRIIGRIPRDCFTLLDLFGGGGVITNNAPCIRRIYNDADWFKANFLICQRDHPKELKRRLARVEYNEGVFLASKLRNEKHRAALDPAALSDDAPPKLDRAVDWYIRNKMSRGGLGRSFAWSDRLRGGRPGDLNAWHNSLASIPLVSARLQGVEINCQHFRDVLRSLHTHTTRRACIYADPPYVHTTRSVVNAYEVEMTDAEHLELLAMLTVKAMEGHAVLISGYANEMYDRVLKGWRRDRHDMPNHSGQGKSKQRRIEVLWRSPARW